MKSLIVLACLFFSQLSFADVTWQQYSDSALKAAQNKGHKVVLGFHKKGCGTCHSQDSALDKAGINDAKKVTFLKVERKNKSHDKVYQKYGFSSRQWAAIVLLDGMQEVARINPGITSGSQVTQLVQKAK